MRVGAVICIFSWSKRATFFISEILIDLTTFVAVNDEDVVDEGDGSFESCEDEIVDGTEEN